MRTSVKSSNHLLHNNLMFVDLAQEVGPGQEMIYAIYIQITVRQSVTAASGAFDSSSSSYLTILVFGVLLFAFFFFSSGHPKAALLGFHSCKAEGTKHGEKFRCCHYRCTKPDNEHLSELLCKNWVPVSHLRSLHFRVLVTVFLKLQLAFIHVLWINLTPNYCNS